MTQADGITPTAPEIRQSMRTVKPLLTALEEALTAAARLKAETPTTRRFEVLATLSEAHAALDAELIAMEVVLGLPYERVIVASYTACFGPDD